MLWKLKVKIRKKSAKATKRQYWLYSLKSILNNVLWSNNEYRYKFFSTISKGLYKNNTLLEENYTQSEADSGRIMLWDYFSYLENIVVEIIKISKYLSV